MVDTKYLNFNKPFDTVQQDIIFSKLEIGWLDRIIVIEILNWLNNFKWRVAIKWMNYRRAGGSKWCATGFCSTFGPNICISHLNAEIKNLLIKSADQ